MRGQAWRPKRIRFAVFGVKKRGDQLFFRSVWLLVWRVKSSSEIGLAVICHRDWVWGSLGRIAWIERRFSARIGFSCGGVLVQYDGQGRRIAMIVGSASVTVGIPSDPAPKRSLP